MISMYDETALRTCKRCDTPYAWHRSPASLKMTYCGSLCENADLGFSLEALERWQPPARQAAPAPVVTAAGGDREQVRIAA